MTTDKIKRGIAELAFSGFEDSKNIVKDGSIGYKLYHTSETELEVMVNDPGIKNYVRRFRIKISEYRP